MEASELASQAALAAAAIAEVTAPVVTAPGEPQELPPVKFDRLSVERRVLGHVTDEVDTARLGPRNSLAALTYALMVDPNTTRPPSTHPRLDIDGKTVEEIAQEVLDHLTRLTEAGLLAQREDGSYEVTEAGHVELAA